MANNAHLSWATLTAPIQAGLNQIGPSTNFTPSARISVAAEVSVWKYVEDELDPRPSAESARRFTPFQNLLPELRVKIWQAAIEEETGGGRIVSTRPHRIPSQLLHVSFEAREEVKRIYTTIHLPKKSWLSKYEPWFYFHPKLDTLELSNLWDQPCYPSADERVGMVVKAIIENKIENIAMSHDTIDEHFHDMENMENDFFYTLFDLVNYQGLKTITTCKKVGAHILQVNGMESVRDVQHRLFQPFAEDQGLMALPWRKDTKIKLAVINDDEIPSRLENQRLALNMVRRENLWLD